MGYRDEEKAVENLGTKYIAIALCVITFPICFASCAVRREWF